MMPSRPLVNGWDPSVPIEVKVDTDFTPLLDTTAPIATKREKIVPNKEIELIDNVFSPDECTSIIQAAEMHGFGRTDYKKSYRLLILT